MKRKSIKTTLRQAYKRLIKPNQFLYIYDPHDNKWRSTDDHVVEQGYCRCNDQEKHLTGDKLCRENGTGERTRFSWDDLVIASRFDHCNTIVSFDFSSPAEIFNDCIVCDGYRIVPTKMVNCSGLLNKFKKIKSVVSINKKKRATIPTKKSEVNKCKI